MSDQKKFEDKQRKKAEDENKGRRRLVKGITVGGGTIIVSKWTKPIVEGVVLPAHAQMSVNLGGGSTATITFP